MADDPTTAAPQTPDPSTPPAPASASEGIDNAKVAKDFKAKADAAEKHIKTFHPTWRKNVEMRLGHTSTLFTGGVAVEDDNQNEVNPDWSIVKTKTANLYSQVPTVQATHENKQYAPAIFPFMKSLNYELSEKRANVGVAMNETLNDVVNASGIAACYVNYAARFEDVTLPVIDPTMIPPDVLPKLTPVDVPEGTTPEQAIALLQQGQLAQVTTKRTTSDKFATTRLSPTDILTPVEFRGSCFDDADWVGYKGRYTWAVAKPEFHLTDDQREKVEGGSEHTHTDTLISDQDYANPRDSKLVHFKDLYYWRYRVDPDEKSFSAIWRIVWVKGLDQPVIHEPWTGQKRDEQSGKYVGSCKFPVRLLTLTYVTDNPIPPSDSAVIRPQVDDKRRSRSQMFQARERNLPINVYDATRVDPEIRDLLMRGVVQGWLPSNGDFNRSFGQIARASQPAEDFQFDLINDADMREAVGLGQVQMGTGTTGGKKTSSEINATQANFATRIGQERAQVASYFLGICEVLAGLMALYSDFPILTEQEKQVMTQAWDRKHILHDLVLKIRPDATIMLDVNSRLDRIFKFINVTVQSGHVAVKPLLIEAAELSGIDPTEVIIDPQPPKPEEPKFAIRLGGDDLVKPLVIALLLESGHKLSPESLDAAKRLLAATQDNTPNPAPTPGASPSHAGGPTPDGPVDGGAHPEWTLAPKVWKRGRDLNA